MNDIVKGIILSANESESSENELLDSEFIFRSMQSIIDKARLEFSDYSGIMKDRSSIPDNKSGKMYYPELSIEFRIGGVIYTLSAKTWLVGRDTGQWTGVRFRASGMSMEDIQWTAGSTRLIIRLSNDVEKFKSMVNTSFSELDRLLSRR